MVPVINAARWKRIAMINDRGQSGDWGRRGRDSAPRLVGGRPALLGAAAPPLGAADSLSVYLLQGACVADTEKAFQCLLNEDVLGRFIWCSFLTLRCLQ